MIKLNGYLHALVALAAIFLSLNNIFLFEKAQHAVADVLKHNEFLKKISEKIPIPRRRDTAVNADSCTCGGHVVDPHVGAEGCLSVGRIRPSLLLLICCGGEDEFKQYEVDLAGVGPDTVFQVF
eukprot:jgi/Picre1/32563/NNA_007909.t1